MKFKWEWWNGSRVSDEGVDKKAARALEAARVSPGIAYCWGGDTLVLAHESDGAIEVVECIVRRTARVKK